MTIQLRAVVLSLVLCLAGVGCGSSDSGSGFQDSLRFGTGLAGNGFDLAGEKSTFSVASLGTSGQIYFRLESAQDMAGRAVRLYIDYSPSDTIYWQKDYTSLQSYGHIFLSSFRVTDAGSYKVKAYLVQGSGIATETHVIDAPLTMTP